MTSVAFRFDVDSHRCLREGVPNLVALAAELDVAFTFHVHLGRATRRRDALRDRLRRADHDGADRLSSTRKLGLRGAAVLAFANPLVGAGSPGIIADTSAAGHEVGVHGGRNHRSWQDGAAEWTTSHLRDEMSWARDTLVAAGVSAPLGFSSPAWQGTDATVQVAAELGFAYVADLHDPSRSGVVGPSAARPLPQPITNVVGEPGGVGFLEWHRARGSDDATVRRDMEVRLSRSPDIAVVYDHPFWAGIHDLARVRSLVETVLARGDRVATLAELVGATLR